jgi:acyl-CoA synthetase (AMP-forming)/AMP-acid ligase II
MNLSLTLGAVARHIPDRPALSWEGGALTYGAFECQVQHIAGALLDRHGLKPGARVALAMENCAELLPALYATWRAGLTAVPINSKLHPRDGLDHGRRRGETVPGQYQTRRRSVDARHLVRPPAADRQHRNCGLRGALGRRTSQHCACRSGGRRFKRPKSYRFVETLPKNNYGKILKTELRQLLQNEGIEKA